MDVDTFFARTRRFLIDLLSRETTNRAVRSQATTWIRSVKDGIELVELAFNSRMLAVYNLSDMGKIASAMIEHIKQQIENPALRDSKFVFDGIIRMDIDFHRLNLTRGSSYIYRKGKEYDRVENLMLITDHNEKHYIAIKSLRRLLSRQNSKHKESQHFCINCLQGFAEKKSRDEHYVYCRSNEAVRIEMPNVKPIVKYSDGQYQFKVRSMMYADFESILEPIQGASNNPNISSTREVNVHTPSGWCLYSKFSYGNVTNPLTQYRGLDCVSKFCKHMISES